MFRKSIRVGVCGHRFPRIRGDVPRTPKWEKLLPPFSPHTRGCSLAIGLAKGLVDVFPAYAGMFRLPPKRSSSLMSFPRIRGDVPPSTSTNSRLRVFSPHTRGCSCLPRCRRRRPIVFPAYAGMFLHDELSKRDALRFPRIRGDVPQ